MINTLKKYKYAICPGGNGPDCHRFWECLYLGVIPIVENNQMIQIYRQWVPMVILNNFQDLDINNLVISLPTKKEKLYLEDYLW